MLPIILGSASRWRQSLLLAAGVKFEVMCPNIDEKAIRHADPDTLVLAIAEAKNQALKPKLNTPSLLITCDQVVVCHGEIYEKPEDIEQARHYLQTYNQYPAETVTGIVIENTATGQQIRFTDKATVYFNPIPEQIIEEIIQEGDIFACAGGFQIEGDLSSQYIKRVEGDINSVKGLPVQRVLEALTSLSS